jgi:demethylmenaquinone methyltransferase/2-methoxy-6-polyprenyl-1,4-benzoquinol methylase
MLRDGGLLVLTPRPGVLPEREEKRRVVQRMFDRIAPRYDAMNRLITFGLDQRWRRVALETIGVGPGDRVLDLACGTGDLAAAALKRGARVVGLDFAAQMLQLAGSRGLIGRLVRGDAERLPLPDRWATCATCGFALRNFVALPTVFHELARVVETGGRIALLEVDRPRHPILRFGHRLYFERMVPALGGWLADRDAYRYLPASAAYLPDFPALRAALRHAGFRAIVKHSLMLGSVQLITARRGVRP